MAVSWNSTTAAYLLRRAGFGATAAEVSAYAALGHEAAVARLVDYESTDTSALEAKLVRLRQVLDAYRPDADNYTQLNFLYYEWVYRMVYSPRPLEEKMTLFWHGHFAISANKVDSTKAMKTYFGLMRSYATGNFREMLLAMSADPAMLIWLDNYLSNKEHPNENYARELLELFALGIGNYTETDVLEIARAFTGWTLRENASRPSGYETIYVDGIHDVGNKAYLGENVPGGFDTREDGQIVCRVVADLPACPAFLATKLWAYFGAGAIPEAVKAAMVAAYFANTYSVREMLRTMFLSEEFYAPGVVGDDQIKSPYDLIAGTLHTIETDPEIFFNKDRMGFLIGFAINHGRNMGQILFRPPNVKGWDTGRKWINTSTLLSRYNFANEIATRRDVPWLNVNGHVDRAGDTAEAIVDYFVTLLGPLQVGEVARRNLIAYMNANADGTPGTFVRDATSVDTKVRGLLKLLLSSVEYQTNARAFDPSLTLPVVVEPVVKKGKLLLAAANSNVASGAVLRVTGASIDGTETFAMKVGAKKILVSKKTRSAPSGRAFEELAPEGTTVTLVIENPDGAQSHPFDFVR